MVHEIHEQIEHAGHAGHESSSRLPQFIGITIALLGVLMALCSAQVGAARTELITTMVEENAAKGRYTAVANKYRNLQAQLQQLHAAMPNLEYLKKKNADLSAIDKEVTDADLRKTIKASQVGVDKILNTVIPTETDVRRFLGLIHRTREETEAAREWSESYHEAVTVHENTASRFEIAMLGTEIGIVIASVGLLLAKKALFARVAWGTALVLGATSMTVAVTTKITNSQSLHGAEEKIHKNEHHFASLNKDEEDIAEDKKLEKDILDEFKELNHVMAGGEDTPTKAGENATLIIGTWIPQDETSRGIEVEFTKDGTRKIRKGEKEYEVPYKIDGDKCTFSEPGQKASVVKIEKLTDTTLELDNGLTVEKYNKKH